MAASFLLSECLERIFSNLLDNNLIPGNYTSNKTSTKDLHSCTLVSRHWCRISTPILYAYPFHSLRNTNLLIDYEYHPDYFKLFRTLLSCIPKSEIEQIISSNSSNLQRLLSNLSP